MCYLTDENLKANVRRLISAQVSKRKTFTGFVIFQELLKLVSTNVKRPNGMAVSSYVRELFNNRNEVYDGYGCYPVPGDKAPLMYFPLPAFAKTNAKKIQEKIEASSTNQVDA